MILLDCTYRSARRGPYSHVTPACPLWDSSSNSAPVFGKWGFGDYIPFVIPLTRDNLDYFFSDDNEKMNEWLQSSIEIY